MSETEASLFDVLVLDDDDLVRGTIVTLLEDQGLRIGEASSPDEALDLANRNTGCRVFVTDIHLGTPLDGFAVAKNVRRLHPDMPIIYISGRADVLREHPLGTDERALFKPFPIRDLLSTIHEFIPPAS